MTRFSIGIPVWNRKTLLKKSLDRLVELKANVEVSIWEDVDDPNEAIDVESLKEYPFPIIYQKGETRPIPRCPVREINKAVAATTGDIVCVSAGEIYHLHNTFAELEAIIQPGSNRFYISPNVNLDKEMTEEFFSGRLDVLSKLGEIHLNTERSKSYVNPVANMRWGIHPIYNPTPIAQFVAMERWLWEKIGGFDEDYGDGNSWGDQNLLMQLWAVGAELVWLNSVVIHPFHGENYSNEIQWKAGQKNKRIFERKWGISGEEIDDFYRKYSLLHRPKMMYSDYPLIQLESGTILSGRRT